jgi:uncharacterized phage protein (TIGR01671 family)
VAVHEVLNELFGGEMMSEEIKFRAWDRRRKKMHMVGAIVWDNGKIVEVDADNGDLIKRYELMQFTGLTDSKRTENYPEGQEIYEGDIISCIGSSGEKETGTIAWDEGDLAWYIENPTGMSIALCFYQSCIRSIEVIGNIHNNPDLLGVGV